MPIDRKKWSPRFLEEDFPSWDCSRPCDGRVRFGPKAITEFESGDSHAYRDHEAWDPEWIHGRFIAHLECDKCGDPTVVAGTWDAIELPMNNWRAAPELVGRFSPRTFLPPPQLVQVPQDVPEEVGEELQRALALFWSDTNACANGIRSTVEAIMDNRRVQKALSKQKRGTRLSLHRRIELFSAKDSEAASWLMAVKWIGNAGSHRGLLTRSDLFDGFDLLEHVLEHLYSNRTKIVSALTRRINKRRKPLSREA